MLALHILSRMTDDTYGNLVADYILPLIGKEGNYHSREIWLYRDQLRENMQQRADAFLKKR